VFPRRLTLGSWGDEASVCAPARLARLGDRAGPALSPFAQAGTGTQGDELLGLRPVVVHWRHREDEPALAQADRLDQDRAAGARQNDHVTGIDVASKDQILHE